MTDNNVAYIYTRKPKRGEKVGSTNHIGHGIYIDYDSQLNAQGVELLNVHEIWVNGKVVWPVNKRYESVDKMVKDMAGKKFKKLWAGRKK